MAPLVGAHLPVPCLDGVERPYRDLDCAASTPALQSVADRVNEFLPWYSSVHRGAGYKSRRATAAYEEARASVHRFTQRPAGGDDVVVLVRNTTEAINQLAYRLGFGPEDVVATTVVEHHANLLPWARVATRRWVECGTDGTFDTADVVRVLEDGRRPALLALTGASNVTGWLSPVEEICAEAHARGVPVLLDAAQLAPHRRLPAGPDFMAFSGHKLYAPFGAGALIGPRRVFERGDPFLAGGGAVDLVDLDEVIWTDPPEREEAGSPNVVGAVAFGTAMDELERIGWDAIAAHEAVLATRLYDGLRAIDGVRVLGPWSESGERAGLAVATFTVDEMHHALVAARLSAEFGVGVRHGCFCAHPYLIRLLGVGRDGVDQARAAVQRGDRSGIPGAVRASCGLGTADDDVDALLDALRALAAGAPPPVPYVQDDVTGDFWPEGDAAGWSATDRPAGAACAAGMSAPVRRCGLLLVALAALVPALAACATPVGGTTVGDVAWVATGASVTLPGTAVTPVALARRHIGAKVSLGSLPSALAYTPESKGLLVVTQGTDSLHEIDPATHQVLHSVGTGVEPDAVAVAPGGTGGKGVALVANLDSNTVTPVDLGTWRAGTPIAVGTEPVAIAVSVAASGAATAFVADYGSNSVTPIDVAALQPGASIAVGPGPQTIAATPSEVLVGNFGQPDPHRHQPGHTAGGRQHSAPAEPDRHRALGDGCDGLCLRERGRGPGGCRRPDVGCARRPARRGAGDRLEHQRDHRVGDATNGYARSNHPGHREGGPPHPHRRPPVRHRHRPGLIRPFLRCAGSRVRCCKRPGPGSAGAAPSAPPCSGRPTLRGALRRRACDPCRGACRCPS